MFQQSSIGGTGRGICPRSQEQQDGGRHGTAQEEENIIADSPILWTKCDDHGICQARGEKQPPPQQSWVRALNQAHNQQEAEWPYRRKSSVIPAHQGKKNRHKGYRQISPTGCVWSVLKYRFQQVLKHHSCPPPVRDAATIDDGCLDNPSFAALGQDY